MIHYHVLADVAAEHRNARVAEGTARRLARHARHASRQHRAGTATQRATSYDVVVVGSRCAGAATAMLLTRAGHRVALVDRTALPSATLSTHGIARGGVVQLSRWGLLDAVLAGGAPPSRRVTFGVDGELTVRARNGFQGIRVTFHVKGAAEAEKLAELVNQAQNRSAVYDVLTSGVPVRVDVAP